MGNENQLIGIFSGADKLSDLLVKYIGCFHGFIENSFIYVFFKDEFISVDSFQYL